MGDLLRPSVGAFVFLGTLALFQVVLAGAIGAVIGGLLPIRWSRSPSLGAFMAMVLGVSLLAGWGLRTERESVAVAPAAEVTAGRPLNVLWVVIDTLRADSLYGHDLDFRYAPETRKIASESVVFRNAESSASWTIPSVSTLLTGMHPPTIGAERGFLAGWTRPIAERLRDAGYDTRAFVDNSLLSERTGFAKGYKEFHQRSTLQFGRRLAISSIFPASVGTWLREVTDIAYEGGDLVTERALQAIVEPRDRPAFFYVHYMDVHAPFRHHHDIAPDPAHASPLELLELTRYYKSGEDPPKEEMDYLWHHYNYEVRFLDRYIGHLVEVFDDQFGEENTLVVITSDHGEEFLEHGKLGHGNGALYEELVHVPLIVRFPESVLPAYTRGSVVDAAVGLVDVMPTVLEAVQVPLSESDGEGLLPVQGRSLLGWLGGAQPAPARPVFATESRMGLRVNRLRLGDLTLVETHSSRGQRHTELFEKGADPGELDDLFGMHEESASMREALMVFLQQLAEGDRTEAEAEGASADPAAMQALGY